MANNVEANIKVNVQTNTGESSKQLNDIASALQRIQESGSAFDRDNPFAESLERLATNGSAFSDVSESLNNVSKSFENLGANSELFTVNGDELVNMLGKLASSSGLSSKGVVKLSEAMGVAGPAVAVVAAAISAQIAALKAYVELCKKCASEVTNMLVAFGDGAVDGIQWFNDSLGELIDLTEEAISKLQEFADMGAEIQNTYFSLYNIMGSAGGDRLSGFANNLEKLYGLDATGIIGDMQSLYSMTAKLSSNMEQATSATESFYLMAQSMSKLYNQDLQTVINSLKTAVNTGNIRANSALYNILDSNDIAEFKKLNNEVERANFLLNKNISIQGVFQQYLDTDAGKIYQLKQQWQSFLGNLGQLALGLYAKIAPLLTNLLKLANAVVTSLMKIFNINVTTATTGGADLKGYLSDITNGLEKEAEAAKEATKQTAKFDDVIQINDTSKNNSTASELAGLSGLDFDSSWLDDIADSAENAESEIDKLIKKLKMLLENHRYFEAGALLSKSLKEWLNSIDWEKVKDDAGALGYSMANFINGFISDKGTFTAIGSALANGINTALNLLYKFAKVLDFSQLGRALAESWSSFWNELDDSLFGHTVYEWFTGIMNSIHEFINNAGTDAGSKFAGIINTFFGDITEDDISTISDDIIGAITWIMDNINAFIDNLNTEDINNKLQELVTEIMTKFADNSGYWGKTLNRLITGVLNFLYETLRNADKSGLSQGIKDFLEELNIGEIFSTWFRLKLQVILTVIKSLLPELFSGLVKFLLYGGPIGLFFGEIAEFAIYSVKDSIAGIGKGITDGLNNIITNLGKIISGLITRIANWCTQIKNAFKNALSNFNPFSGMNFSLPNISGFKISLPWSGKHATGGITNGPSIGMIGEAGREAVLPLDRNTSWMDELAGKLAGRINNNEGAGSGGNITIDMSGYAKNFYTRSEMLEFGKQIVEALKVYGVNVAMVG